MPCRPAPTLAAVALFALATAASAPAAALTTLWQFNPTEVGESIVGAGYDAASDSVWIYSARDSVIRQYSALGQPLSTQPIPNPLRAPLHADIDVLPAPIVLRGDPLPAGTLFFINGDSTQTAIEILDPSDGRLINRITANFGAGHVVVGTYHPTRNSFFLLQDHDAPIDRDTVAEIDLTTGALLSSFSLRGVLPGGGTIADGDLTVSPLNGNLLLASGNDSNLYELTPTGTFLRLYQFPTPLNATGLGVDATRGEVWVTTTTGLVYDLGYVPEPPPLFAACGLALPFLSRRRRPV